MQTDHYTYRVTWSAEDREHVGLCAEFPSLSWLAKTPTAALLGIRRLVAQVVTDMKANREIIPEPLAERHYSGEFRVRIPPEVHRALAIKAAEQGVSLNRLVSAKLAGGAAPAAQSVPESMSNRSRASAVKPDERVRMGAALGRKLGLTDED